MRFLCIILNIFLMIQVASANDGRTQSLKAIYDDLQYSLTVEWDQKDVEFQKKAEDRFKKGLEELNKQGLTNKELIDFAASQFKNTKNQADFLSLMQSLQVTTLSQKEMSSMVNAIISKEYNSGANFIGDFSLAGKIAYFTGLAVISTGLIFAMIYGSFEGISDNSSEYSCSEVYVCDTYYDEFGAYESCGYQCW